MLEVLLSTSRMFGAEAAGEKASGIAALGVDGKALVLQIVTFVIVFLILKKFAFSKIVAMLEKRQDTINKGVNLGLEMQAEKDKLADEIEALLQKARVQADKITAEAHTQAGELLKDAEVAAGRKVEALLADAHNRIEEDIKRARKSLEHETLSLIAEATEAIIGEKLDAKKDASLIERVLKGVH